MTLAHNAGDRSHPRDLSLQPRANEGQTVNVPRPKIGSVPYGSIITRCTQSNVVALTFDDGPGPKTSQLLDLLREFGAKATFFVTANNIYPIESEPGSSLVRRALAEGHQVASHTWRHQDLSAIGRDERAREVLLTESAMANVFQRFPTYIRPPYGSCDGACLSHLGELGYHVINWSVDTDDWRHQDDIAQAEAKFAAGVNGNPGHIVLSHDIHAATVDRLARYMLQTSRDRGLRFVTVGECLGDPAGNWYRAADGSGGGDGGNGGLTPSVDGTCGGTVTCAGTHWGTCCSQYGWCGVTDEHCRAGCQPAFGTCL